MTNSSVDQIKRAHASARPKAENPAWMNCHHDCGVLLAEIERLQRERTMFSEMLDAAHDERDRLRAALELAKTWLPDSYHQHIEAVLKGDKDGFSRPADETPAAVGDVVVECPRCEMRFLAPEDVVKRPAEETSAVDMFWCDKHGPKQPPSESCPKCSAVNGSAP